MQKPIYIQIPLSNPNHNPPPGEHGEILQKLTQIHGTGVMVDNRQKMPGTIRKAFSNHHPAILIIFCHPFLSGPCQDNLSKIGLRYQTSEKVRMNTVNGHPILSVMNGRILEAAEQLWLPHRRWALQQHLTWSLSPMPLQMPRNSCRVTQRALQVRQRKSWKKVAHVPPNLRQVHNNQALFPQLVTMKLQERKLQPP